MHADKARLSHELVRLRDDVSAPFPLENLVRRKPDQDALLNFLKDQGFRSIIARIQSRVQSQGQGTPPSEIPSNLSHYSTGRISSSL